MPDAKRTSGRGDTLKVWHPCGNRINVGRFTIRRTSSSIKITLTTHGSVTSLAVMPPVYLTSDRRLLLERL